MRGHRLGEIAVALLSRLPGTKVIISCVIALIAILNTDIALKSQFYLIEFYVHWTRCINMEMHADMQKRKKLNRE